MAGVYTVTQINSYIKNMFRQDFVLNHVFVKGEISNCKYHTSGHIYFTLKDESGTLSIVMFASNAAKLDFALQNGMQVEIEGRIDVYERDGKYQLYASKIKMNGEGDLHKKYEQLKKYFEEMGYFSKDYKRPIPRYAKKIGVVTAKTGAAVHDIITISKRRNPYISIYLYPALVQGENAKYSIVDGIQKLDELGLDVIIVGRGGGSIEDLWAFNEEIVAEAIFAAKTPIISAVGHETDFTIADFVADMRASTPSAAAELAVCDISVVENVIEQYNYRINNIFTREVEKYRQLVNNYELRIKYLNPVNQVNEKRQIAAQYLDKLDNLMKNRLTKYKNNLSLFASRLEGVSPVNRLGQGYSYTENAEGKNISSIKDVAENDIIKTYVKDGVVSSRVEKADKFELI
ncbi:MAG: exodeoxyribonuclease VII large subunit [Lachnospira sp.]|nr:exodeoxyribonuclease VII large subunit [Lachnospira sp.]MDD5829084.1 exodeoxyribonuclease VII large subunit [Lachnospira sp.]